MVPVRPSTTSLEQGHSRRGREVARLLAGEMWGRGKEQDNAVTPPNDKRSESLVMIYVSCAEVAVDGLMAGAYGYGLGALRAGAGRGGVTVRGEKARGRQSKASEKHAELAEIRAGAGLSPDGPRGVEGGRGIEVLGTSFKD